MTKTFEREKMYTYIAFAATLIVIAYLSLFLYNAYYTFHEYSDLGVMAYSLYFNLNYPQIARGFQYLVFGNHISPDMALFVLPIFYLHQSSLTLLLIQLVFVYASAILVFFIAKGLTKNNLLALLLCFAFLIYPGNLGMVIFDAHIEFMITFFFLLTFYYYMKSRFYEFLLSSFLLLGTTEVTPLLGFALGAGMLVYEYRYNKHRKISESKKWFALLLIVLSLFAALFYSYVSLTLLYSQSYTNLPAILSIAGGIQNSLGSYVSKFLHNPLSQLSYDAGLYLHAYAPYLVYSVLLILFGFGITLFFVPDVAFILIIPWLSGVFIFQDPSFLQPLNEYFSYVVGPAVCATILGILVSKDKDNHLSKFLIHSKIGRPKLMALSIIVGAVFLSLLAPILYLYVVSPASTFHSVNSNEIGQLLFFRSNQSQINAYRQLNSIIKLVPKNTSLLTEYFIMPHLINRESLDFVPGRIQNPEYVLIDFNRNISDNSCKPGFENCTAFENVINNGNYSIYAQNGTTKLYKRN